MAYEQKHIVLTGLLSLFCLTLSMAQETGPVFTDYGKVFTIDNPDIPASTDIQLKAVFDVYDSPASREQLNPQLETAARFLNMHVRSGVKPENLAVALVVHGKATEDLLRPGDYLKKHGVASPNADLVRQLLNAGVQIAVCGQSASSRDIGREQTIPGVQWSLSAMTALIVFQNEGYQIIKF